MKRPKPSATRSGSAVSGFALSSIAFATLVAVLVALGTSILLAGPSWAMLVYQMLTNGTLLGCWLLSAAGWGALVLRGIAPEMRDERTAFIAVTHIALGLGFMGLAVLTLGLAGWLNFATAATLLSVGAVLLVGLNVSRLWVLREAVEKHLSRQASWGWLWVSIMPPLGISLVASIAPPGLLWKDEPNGYDVVEYHLQVPRQWFDAGRIYPLHENVFSYFPMGMEMHFLLAMHLHGGPIEAMYLCQLMHLTMCVLAVFAVRSILGAGVGTVAGVLMAASPWMSLLAPVAYVEGAVLFYGALCVGWAIRAMDREAMASMVVAGVLGGFACGVKLTNVPMLLAAVPVAFLATLVLSGRGLREPFLACGAFVVSGAAALSPWLLRTWRWTGNPVFPEAMTLLGRGHFSLVQMQRWINAYRPDPKYASIFGHINAMVWEFALDIRYGWVLLPLAVTALVKSRTNVKTRFIAMLMVCIGIIWVAFTHLQSRFLVLELPLCAFLVGQIKLRGWMKFTGVTAVALCGFTTAWLFNAFGNRPDVPRMLALDRLAQHAGGGLLGRVVALRPFQPDMAEGKAIYLVGDAYVFCYPVPSSQLHYRTIFDVDTSLAGQSLMQAWIGAEGVATGPRLIVIDPAELSRFSRTYPPIPAFDAKELEPLWSRPDVYIETAIKPAR